MKMHPFNKSQIRSRRHSAGFTLIEISLVIALLLGLITVVFMGLGSYRKGADKAKCKMQLAAVQKAVRSQANMQNLNIGAAMTSATVFGAGLIMENTPICPGGGAYTWEATLPAMGTPYGVCSYTDGATTPTTHALAATEVADW